VGRIIADRGLGTLLDAFAHLETPQRLVIVGDVQVSDSEMQELRQRADGRVLFTGFQTGETLQQLYAHASLCVHPSEIEGLPIAVLEAMAHGRPVVVSDIAENLEAVGDAGLSFPVGDPDALAALLRDLMAHPERAEACGERARRRVQRFYDWDAIAKATEEVYVSVVEARAR
jgi:glycosyltransferase involved in cell wall biosynthesis